MGGVFGVVSKEPCAYDLFFGTDYHSHLGTKRGGMAVYGEKGFERAIHNIENSPFRTKFEKDVDELTQHGGHLGIGCISDSSPQPLLVHSKLGSYAITTVGKINNSEELVKESFDNGFSHFLETSGGVINPSEVVAALINQKDTMVEGIKNVLEKVDGSMTFLILTKEGIYAVRDRLGRTPLIIGKKDNGDYCVSFESFAFINLGYKYEKELGPGEIVYIDHSGYKTLSEPQKKMKICTFLWVYYGYPTSCYEGLNVEEMRYKCGEKLAMRDREDNSIEPDIVAGVPDSGIADAVGYANSSGIPFARPFIKYTPTWPRSFMPSSQDQRNRIAKMKLIPVDALIRDKKLLLIDDSIVRGTQLGETTGFLYESGAKEVHIRPACPPLLYGCKYLNFSRSKSELDLITRRIILEREGEERASLPEVLEDYANPDSQNYKEMLDEIRKKLNFTSLKFLRLDDMIDAITENSDIKSCDLCTYCWNGAE